MHSIANFLHLKKKRNKTVDDENDKTSEPKKRGSKPLLVDEHKDFVENEVRENATVTLETFEGSQINFWECKSQSYST